MGSFADKIIKGINAILSFLANLFKPLFDLISGGFEALFDLLAKPLAWLLWLLEGIFYFFQQIFNVVVVIVKIFVALFEYLGALIAGVFRFIGGMLTVQVNPNTKFVSATESGFATVIDLLQGTGLLTVVPLVATAFVWFFFALKVFGAFGGSVVVSPFSSRGSDK